MSILPDDPRLTAFALDELDATERTVFERELADDAEAQAAVADIRRTIALLREELATMPALALSDDARSAIQAAAVRSASRRELSASHSGRSILNTSVSRRHAAVSWALAASLLVALGAAIAAQPRRLANGSIENVRASARQFSEGVQERAGISPGAPGTVVDAFGDGLSRGFVAPSDPTAAVDALAVGGADGGVQLRLSELSTITNGEPPPGRKDFAYTVAVPVYETRSKDICYTVCKPVYETKVRGLIVRQKPNSGAVVHLHEQARLAGQVNHWNFGIVEDLKEGLVQHDGPVAAPVPAEWDDAESLALGDHNTEAYDPIVENPFLAALDNPLSTFSIDVDTASYSNVRRFLRDGVKPPPGAVRIEELLNYFPYDYAPPTDDAPFAAHMQAAECPWRPAHRLVRVALKGREIEADKRPPTNLVFLIDVSGSMEDENKLPLVKKGLRMLVERLGENDRVAMVVYAGNSGLALDSTRGDQRESILASIDQLEAGGSTNGGEGIELAYAVAKRNFQPGGVNRVVLATDGDFNVGVTDQSQLVDLIEQKAKDGVFLSVLGFGMGNYKDSTLEKLADKGNGNYAYIDTENEARKTLVEQMTGTLVTIAKDVKIQVEFNPARVAAYRLVGYENRLLAKEDFNDDTKDAGEIGAGHTITALYEIVPAGEASEAVDTPDVDDLEFQRPAELTDAARESGELLVLKLRYKAPDADTSKLLRFSLADRGQRIGEVDGDFQFAAAVAGFGMLLRNSEHRGDVQYDTVLELAQAGLGDDPAGYRGEFLDLVKIAKQLPN